MIFHAIVIAQFAQKGDSNMDKSKKIALIALFVATMAVCSWISIPLSVPITLQTFAIFVACGVLGGQYGTIAVCVYVLIGAIGVPVFSGFSGGPGKLLGPTGGYIIGFILTALIMWGMSRLFGEKLYILVSSMIIGLIACYAFGTAWFVIVYTNADKTIDVLTTLSMCVFPFIIPDIIKIILAVVVTKSLRRFGIHQ